MPRKVKKSDVERWLQLREEGHTYKEMQKITKWNSETIRKHVEEATAEKERAKKYEAEKAKAEKGIDYAKIFSVFDDGKDPTEVVKRGLCTPEQAKKAIQDYADLKGKTSSKVETAISDLNEGQDNLLDRIEELETTIGAHLSREWKCSKCGAKGNIAVLVQCTACKEETWWGHWPYMDEEQD
jgi:hypothetical protein